VDASVFVNAFSPTEEGSDHSWEYINRRYHTLTKSDL